MSITNLPTRQSSLPDRIPWDEFLALWQWEQADHVAVIGPVKSGKSTLIRAISWRRDWVCGLCTKKKDDTYDAYLAQGYVRFTDWPPPKPKRHQRQQYLLQWPKIKTLDDLYNVGPKFQKTMEQVFIDEGWTLLLDDLYYLSHVIRVPASSGPGRTTYRSLVKEISALNYQVRSMGVTLVSAMQRPAWIPIGCWDQSTYAFLSNISNVDDINTIRGLANVSPNELRGWMQTLQAHEWLFLPVAAHVRNIYPPLIVCPPYERMAA